MTDTPTRRRILRPRNVLIACALAVLLALVLVLVPVVRISMARPGSNPGAADQLAALIERFQPEGSTPAGANAFDALLAATTTAQDLHAEHEQRLIDTASDRFGRQSILYAGLDPAAAPDPAGAPAEVLQLVPQMTEQDARALQALHRQAAIAYLDELETTNVFDLLDRAASTPRAAPVIRLNGPMIFRALPDLRAARGLARSLRGQFLRSAQAGDMTAAVRAHRHIRALARVHSHDPSLLSRLVAIAISSLADNMVSDAARDGLLDESALAAILDDERRQPLAPWELAIESERLQILDIIARAHSDDGHGSGYALPTELGGLTGLAGVGGGGGGASAPSIRNVPGLFLARKAETVDVINTMFDAWLDAAAQPPHARPAGPTAVPELESRRFQLVTTILPALGASQRSQDRYLCTSSGTRLLLAIELHRARAGQPPDSLDALVPDILPALPEDPFAPGGRFVYRRLDTPDKHGRAYLLYSVAADGQDNNASPLPGDRPFDAFNDDEPGTDYLFTPAPKDTPIDSQTP